MRISVSSLPMLTALAFGLAATASATGCSDENDDQGGASSGTGGGEPVYAVASSVTSPAQTTYVVLSSSLTGELDTATAALEVPGSAVIAGPPGGRRLYVGTAANGEVRRFDLGADGRSLIESGSVNFEARQVPNLSGYGSGFQFVDAHKAYWLSWTAGKVVVWDPEEMVVTNAIDAPALIRDNPDSPGTPYTMSVTGAPLRDGNTLYYFTAWDSRNAGVVKVAPASGVVAIDTTTNTVQVTVDEDGCGYARDGVVSGDYIYLVTEAVGSSVHYLNEANGPAPCMRRFNRATKQFDDGYKVELNSLAGAPVGSLVTSPSGQAFVYVLDTSAADPLIANKTISNPRILSVSSLWRTARLTVGDSPAVDLLDNPPTSSSVLPHTLANGFKVSATFDPATQQVREVGDTGLVASSRANAKLFGNTGSIVQLR